MIQNPQREEPSASLFLTYFLVFCTKGKQWKWAALRVLGAWGTWGRKMHRTIIVQLRRSLVFKQKELKHQNRKQTSTTSSISHLFVQRFSAAQRKATPWEAWVRSAGVISYKSQHHTDRVIKIQRMTQFHLIFSAVSWSFKSHTCIYIQTQAHTETTSLASKGKSAATFMQYKCLLLQAVLQWDSFLQNRLCNQQGPEEPQDLWFP